IFVLTYLMNIIYFQVKNEYQTAWTILAQVLGFFVGLSLIIMVTLTYFFRTNKDIILMYGMESSDSDPNAPFAEHLLTDHEKKKKRRLIRKRTYVEKSWRVDTYLSNPYKVKLVRNT